MSQMLLNRASGALPQKGFIEWYLQQQPWLQLHLLQQHLQQGSNTPMQKCCCGLSPAAAAAAAAAAPAVQEARSMLLSLVFDSLAIYPDCIFRHAFFCSVTAMATLPTIHPEALIITAIGPLEAPEAMLQIGHVAAIVLTAAWPNIFANSVDH
mmetsp:Transcript_63969/g.126549  ORF Transcript_63969/g.126549 Transcript_63969/m.126549 type:complete len:153 (+) Transcript_63969:188-646(+)